MSTQRRINTSEKTHLDQDETKSGPKSNIAPAVPSFVSLPFKDIPIQWHYSSAQRALADRRGKSQPYRSIIFKLLAFTFAMITLPIGSYFLSVNAIFGGNSTYAGATAAVVANIVLLSYVVVAFNDDKSEREADMAAGEGRKEK
ncbi:hypothetical protein Q7P37_000116 [Cladosporium fusiforme]